MLVFDKTYNYYLQFAHWINEEVYIVCQLKYNVKFEIQKVLFEKLLEKNEYGMCHIEHIHLEFKKNKKIKGYCLRLFLLRRNRFDKPFGYNVNNYRS